MVLLHILIATIFVSLVSVVGIFTFGMRKNIFDKILMLLVGFSAGALLGGAFIHILPEAIEKYGTNNVFMSALCGFTLFFLLERFLYWRHCHNGVCEVHNFTYLNLIGDGVHNFTDGLIIAASFVTDFKLGVVTTLAVIFHEIPQEMGDFGVLVYGGFTKAKALFFNFICALAAVFGAIIGYFLSHSAVNISLFLLSFTAGGFIYIAAADLIPELHKQKNNKISNASFIAFILGIIFMILAKSLLEHI